MDFPDSLFFHPNHPLLPAGFPNYILCLHRADVDKFFWSANTDTSMRRDPVKNVTYEFVLAFPALSHMSSLFYFDDFRDLR